MSDTDVTTHGHTSGHAPSRTLVPVPVARADEAHLQGSARYPGRVEGLVAACFVLGVAGFIGFGVAYWQNAEAWTLAVSFGIGLFFFGFGTTAWGKYLMPQGPFVEERHDLAGTSDEQDAMAAALVERTGIVVKRRGLLGGLLALAGGVFGLVLLLPLLRSLGPVPKSSGPPQDSLQTTNWRAGVRLVDASGRPIKADEIVDGGIVTVFPEGYQDREIGQAVDQTVVIRHGLIPVRNDEGQVMPGTPGGFIAYSKLCTHLGCPVGLYEKQLGMLVCPCHQSMFKVTNGAEPVFGPAPRPLPRLPLAIDNDGYLRAAGGYNQPVGPGYWSRGSSQGLPT
jgi:ubiquinol-cytochrome c reductase iron-sulfur subunit